MAIVIFFIYCAMLMMMLELETWYLLQLADALNRLSANPAPKLKPAPWLLDFPSELVSFISLARRKL